jgi:DNA-binding response OmpR family regulator
MRILLVEDDQRIAIALMETLRDRFFFEVSINLFYLY